MLLLLFYFFFFGGPHRFINFVLFTNSFVLSINIHYVMKLLSQFVTSGIEEATFGDAVRNHLGLCRLRGVSPPTVSALAAVRCDWERKRQIRVAQ